MKGMFKTRTYRKQLFVLCSALLLLIFSSAYIIPGSSSKATVKEQYKPVYSESFAGLVNVADKPVTKKETSRDFLQEAFLEKINSVNNSLILQQNSKNTVLPGATPVPPEGPGGPILVITTTTNPYKFSRYTIEILKAEGFNEYTAEDISLITPAYLGNFDVVILGEMTVTAAQVTMFTNWVNAGGTLIAFRPSNLLAPLMGISSAGSTMADKYLLVNTASGPGVGIVNQTIQYHGTADLYTLSGATSLATLYSSASTATSNPAVTTRSVGAGKAIAFTYDLNKSIIYTRQGNPAWAGQKRDGQIPPIRSDDMFFGQPAGTGADWVDLNKVAIPQADEQQRFLANIIIQNNLSKKPLPRFWFLPKGLKAAVVMTGDDHGNGGTVARFNEYITLSDGKNSAADVANWDAIRGTSYVYSYTAMTNAQALAFQNQGFEISVHLNVGCDAPVDGGTWSVFWSAQAGDFAAAYPSIHSPQTHRTHCVAWADWATQAKLEAQNGVRLDANYYYWPEEWMHNVPGMFTGSGMPMPFADLDGTIINCYQLTTQITDETNIPDYNAYLNVANSLLDKANGTEGYYGVFCANMHSDNPTPHPGADAIIASAKAHNVPVVSAKQMLDWLDGRNNSSFSSLVWNGNALSFTVTAAAGSNNIKAMLPLNSSVGPLLNITRNGSPVAFTTETIKGIQYAFFDSPGGNYIANYQDPTKGTLNGVVALQGRPAAPNAQWAVPVEVNLYTTGGSLVATYNTLTNENGQFVVGGITPGTYNIGVKNLHTLRNIKTNRTIVVGNNAAIDFGTLLEGDANNDNMVTSADFSILLGSYNKGVGPPADPGYDSRANFNEDGYVTLADFSLLLNNYNKAGDIIVP